MECQPIRRICMKRHVRKLVVLMIPLMIIFIAQTPSMALSPESSTREGIESSAGKDTEKSPVDQFIESAATPEEREKKTETIKKIANILIETGMEDPQTLQEVEKLLKARMKQNGKR